MSSTHSSCQCDSSCMLDREMILLRNCLKASCESKYYCLWYNKSNTWKLKIWSSFLSFEMTRGREPLTLVQNREYKSNDWLRQLLWLNGRRMAWGVWIHRSAWWCECVGALRWRRGCCIIISPEVINRLGLHSGNGFNIPQQTIIYSTYHHPPPHMLSPV